VRIAICLGQAMKAQLSRLHQMNVVDCIHTSLSSNRSTQQIPNGEANKAQMHSILMLQLMVHISNYGTKEAQI